MSIVICLLWMLFWSIVVLLSWIWHFVAYTLFCCKFAFVAIYALFRVKFLPPKLWSCNYFDKYHVCKICKRKDLIFFKVCWKKQLLFFFFLKVQNLCKLFWAVAYCCCASSTLLQQNFSHLWTQFYIAQSIFLD